MVEAIKKIVLRLFPELAGQYHLPRFARVVAVSDPPEAHALCDEFRPYYAVDVQVLDAQGMPDTNLPVYQAVPLPVPQAGIEAGQFRFPDPGTVVVLHFAYGLPHKPFISQVLPLGLPMPAFELGDSVWAQGDQVQQKADRHGNWVRRTLAAIIDESLTRRVSAADNHEQYEQSEKTVMQHCMETVKGVKKIVAYGALRLVSGGSANLSAAENLNLTAGADLNQAIGAHKKTTVVGSEVRAVKGTRTTTVSGADSLNAGSINVVSAANHSDVAAAVRDIKATVIQLQGTASVLIQAPSIALQATTIAIGAGGGGTDVLQVLSGLIDVVEQLATTTATHTHGSNGASSPSTSGSHSSQAAAASALNGQLSSLMP